MTTKYGYVDYVWAMENDRSSEQEVRATEGSAMVFSSTGTRMATIKPITMPHGAKITFDLKFGGSSVSCAGMIPSRKKSPLYCARVLITGKHGLEIETWKGVILSIF